MNCLVSASSHKSNQKRLYNNMVHNKLLPETHEELKRVTRVHSVRIFSFAKYHIWKHKEFVRE